VWCRITTFLATVPHYVGFLVWPFHLHYDRDFQPVTEFWNVSVISGASIIAAMTAVIVRARGRRGFAISFGLFWFAAADILHTGILVPVNASLLEHWLYLPSVGLFLGCSQAIAITKIKKGQRKALVGVVGFLAVFCLVLTHQQNKVWHDAEHFYLNIFANGEPSPHAHNNLGIEYTLRGEYQKALEQYELSIQYSGDTNAATHHNLAITLLNGPNAEAYTQEAIRHFKRALDIDPDYYPASLALSEMYRKVGENDKARYYDENSARIQGRMMGKKSEK
jgi:tetratricopeptide (TPR) repeat protein